MNGSMSAGTGSLSELRELHADDLVDRLQLVDERLSVALVGKKFVSPRTLRRSPPTCIGCRSTFSTSTINALAA